MTSQDSGLPLEAGSQKNVRGKAGILFLILLTAVLLAMGFSYYRVFLLNHRVSTSLLSFSHEMDWNKHQIADLQHGMLELQQQLQQQEQVLRRQVQQAQEGQAAVQAGLSGRGRDYSAIVAAQYYVSQANNQLKWMSDVPQALNWLTGAQNELVRVADPHAAALKKAVADDIAALKTQPVLDVTQLYLHLTALSQQVGKLPLLFVPTQEKNAVSLPALAPTASFWEKARNRLSAVLGQMVVVYRLPAANMPPFIAPDQRPYFYENVRAALNAALWAVLHHDSQIYHSSLQQADTWVRQYFSMTSPSTQAVLIELQALQKVSLQPAKDVVLISPQAFEDYLRTELNSAA